MGFVYKNLGVKSRCRRLLWKGTPVWHRASKRNGEVSGCPIAVGSYQILDTSWPLLHKKNISPLQFPLVWRIFFFFMPSLPFPMFSHPNLSMFKLIFYTSLCARTRAEPSHQYFAFHQWIDSSTASYPIISHAVLPAFIKKLTLYILVLG